METTTILPNLNSPSVKTLIGNFVSLVSTKIKDNLIANENNEDPLFKQFEEYAHAAETKPKGEKKEKRTYKGEKLVVDEATGEKKKIEVDLPLKKFASITVGVKNALVFMLNKYITECKAFYENNKSFSGVNDVVDAVDRFAKTALASPITPFIKATVDAIKIDNLVPGTYLKFSTTISEKIRVYFKDKNDTAPEEQLLILTNVFMKFLKILAYQITNQNYENRRAINETFLYSILRVMNLYTYNANACMDVDLFQSIKEYVIAIKPEKAEKPEGEEKEKKKRAPAKKSKAKVEEKNEIDEAVDEEAEWDFNEEESEV